MSTRFMEIIENISNCLNSVCAVELLCRANWIYRHSLRNQQNILSPPIRTLYHFTQVHLQIKDGDNNNKEEAEIENTHWPLILKTILIQPISYSKPLLFKSSGNNLLPTEKDFFKRI